MALKGLNSFNARTDIGQGLQSIALAMFGGGGANADSGKSELNQAHANLYDEQREDLLYKRRLQDQMLEEQALKKAKANAAFLSAKSGLDPTQAEALTWGAQHGIDLPNPEYGFYNPKQQATRKLQEQAAMSAIAASMMDDPTKATAGAGNTNNMELAYQNALESSVQGAILNGEISPEQAARFNAAGGKDRYAQTVENGISSVVDKFAGGVTHSNSPIAEVFVDNKKADTGNKKAQAANNYAGAGEKKARTTQIGVETNLINETGGKTRATVADQNSPTGFSYVTPKGGRLSGAPAKAQAKSAAPKTALTYIGNDANGNPQYKTVKSEVGATITKPKGNSKTSRIDAKRAGKAPLSTSNTQALSIKKQFKEGKITREQAKAQLKQIGMGD